MVRSKIRKKYSGPTHLWQMERIKDEAVLKKEYGYKNKKELWKVTSVLRNFRAQARRLIPLTDKQALTERKQLLDKLTALGLIKAGAQIDDVLGLSIKELMERRLQTIILKKHLANTIKQARQFITHGHITIGDNKVTSPSMLVKVADEPYITYCGTSTLTSDMHPERLAGKEKREKAMRKEELEEKAREARAKEKKKKEEEEVGVSEKEAKEILEAAEVVV
jgi:small subunit ribosomal protein S4